MHILDITSCLKCFSMRCQSYLTVCYLSERFVLELLLMLEESVQPVFLHNDF